MFSLKRAFDISASAVGLVVSSPVILLCAFSMAVANRSSPVFLQERIGYKKQPFTIIKIKSMKDVFNEQGRLAPEEERTTKLGEFIRKTKLDELPQLFNILKGDMSLVGPRPATKRRSIAFDSFRCSVTPGLTGLSQINGTNKLSLDEILVLDHRYVSELKKKSTIQGFLYDLKIIARTPYSLIKHRNAPNFRKI